MTKLTFTIPYTDVYNSPVTSNYKPEELIFMIDRKLLLRLVQWQFIVQLICQMCTTEINTLKNEKSQKWLKTV